jgi:hypothetical protein
MRSSLFLILFLLLARPAAALELQSPTDGAGMPVTTGAIMESAKAIVLLPEGESTRPNAAPSKGHVGPPAPIGNCNDDRHGIRCNLDDAPDGANVRPQPSVLRQAVGPG